mmetsp:Transcript_27896/g.64990  ORF Transcript_27896/g.64990 Transcript_27896/m.64990 type:complete len:222 (+) Transcript_27896:1222-1887(+)
MARHERHDVEHNDPRDDELEAVVLHHLEAVLPQGVLRALFARDGLEVVNDALRLLPLLLLGRRERRHALVQGLDPVVVVDDGADNEVQQHKSTDDNVERAIHRGPRVVVGDRGHSVAGRVNDCRHDIHPPLCRCHLKHGEQTSQVVVERVRLVGPRAHPPAVARVDALDNRRDGLLPAHGGGGGVERPPREPRGPVPHHGRIVVTPVELPLEHLHSEHSPH